MPAVTLAHIPSSILPSSIPHAPNQQAILSKPLHLDSCLNQVIEHKQTNIETLTSPKSRVKNIDDWILIGGDLFTIGYLVLEAILAIATELAASPHQMTLAVAGFGLAAGVINIGVGLISFKNALVELKNGHYKGALRLFFDSLYAPIGCLMLIASLSPHVAAFGGLGLLIVSNPWLLPCLFLIANLPMICEIIGRLYHIEKGTTLASQILHSPTALPTFQDRDYSPQEILQTLSDTLEKWQDSMGAQAALELFTFKAVELYTSGKSKEKIQEAFEKRRKEWERAQWVRALQMALFTAATLTSLIALAPHCRANPQLFATIENFALAGGNLIALGMDICWPLKRNTHLPIPGIFSTAKTS